MKRIIFGILVLVGVWQLLQVPSVNAAFFAFMTLGINPLTNHPLSTISLVSILVAAGFVALLLFFGRVISDFSGGLADWLTHAEHAYSASPEEAIQSQPLNLTSLPARTVIEQLAEPSESMLTAMLSSLGSDAARAMQFPALGFAWVRAHMRGFAKWCTGLFVGVQSRLNTFKAGLEARWATTKGREKDTNIAPELAEVLALFERLARNAEAAESTEAVVIEPTAPKLLTIVRARLLEQRGKLTERIAALKAAIAHDAAVTTSRVGKFSRAVEDHADDAAHEIVESIAHGTKSVGRTTYRAMLLGVLGVLLVGEKVGHVTLLLMRRGRRAAVVSAVAITLGMFAAGRGSVAFTRAIGRSVVTVCRAVYWAVSMFVTLALLGSGYMLFVFSLLVCRLWEICEPHAKKLDKWLGKNLDDKEGLTEFTKVGREMTRTLAQWYRELRNVKHSASH